MTEKRWMIDCDGVLLDLNGAFCTALNDKFHTTYEVADVRRWHYWDEQPKDHGDYIWRECFPSRDFLLGHIQPYPGAMEAIADLLTDPEMAGELKVVTKRPVGHHPMLVEWFAKHLPLPLFDPWGFIICTGREHKATYVKHHRLNIIVEDAAHTLQDPRMSRHGERLYLIDRPWNRGEIVPLAERVSSLQEAVDREATVLAA